MLKAVRAAEVAFQGGSDDEPEGRAAETRGVDLISEKLEFIRVTWHQKAFLGQRLLEWLREPPGRFVAF
jgi:hypothetical protein